MLIELQRSAGNQAVARTLGQRRLARFAVAVNTTPGAAGPTIQTVNIGDRPTGIFGSADRSHTVGWVTFCDGLRFDILGQTPDYALQRVSELYQLVLALPSMGRAGNLQAHPAARHQAALTDAANAHAQAGAVLANPLAYTDQAKVQLLQRFAASYLLLRNTIPQAAVHLHNPSGGAPIANVRAHELGTRVVDAGTLRAELWGQLDRRAVAKLLGADTTAAEAPGVDDGHADANERARRALDVIRDHLTTMQASYPIAFAASGINANASVSAFLTERVATAHPEGANLPDTWIPILANAVVANALPVLPPHRGRAAVQARDARNARFGVQLAVGPNGRLTRDVRVGGRPPSLFGSSDSQGSHTTAHVVFGDVIAATVAGKTPAVARADLVAFGDPLTVMTARHRRLGPKGARAFATATQLYVDGKALQAPISPLEQLQEIATGVMALLNTAPLAAAHLGGVPDAHLEARSRRSALQANTPGAAFDAATRGPVVGALWGLFDERALPTLLGPEIADGGMPGAIHREDRTARAADAIRRHITLVTQAYPDAVARSGFGDAASLGPLFEQSSTNITHGVAQAIALHLGLDAAAVVRSMRTVAAANKRRAEEEAEPDRPRKKRRTAPGIEHDPDDMWTNDGEDDFNPELEKKKRKRPTKLTS